MTFRFAVFAAVSSPDQVRKRNKVTGETDEKDSLDNQVRECRAFGKSHGGTETVGPFIADGYSRSDYEGLSEAMADIPALREAVESAARNEYDVLLVRYFNRLGSFDKMLLTRFKRLNKQLRSVQEFTPITPPEMYNSRKDSSTTTQVQVAGIFQEQRIDQLVNMRAENMPHRIENGLPASRPPYGYRWTSTETPAEQIPEQCAKLLQAKQMLFDGASYGEIAKFLGVANSTVPETLANSYYSGAVFFGRRVKAYDGDRETRIFTPESTWTVGRGKHTPLWTSTERDEIISEIERRREVIRNHNPSHPLMGLLRCGVCGSVLRKRQKYSESTQETFLMCKAHGVGHVGYTYEECYKIVLRVLEEEIRRAQSGAVGEVADSREESYKKAIAEKKKQRRRIQEGYEAEPPLYTLVEASKLLRELDKETEQLERDTQRVQREQRARAEAVSAMHRLGEVANDLWIFISNNPPEKSNVLLRGAFREIRLWNGGVVQPVRR